jgi:hypothetical protein
LKHIIVEKHFELLPEEQSFVDFLMSDKCPYYLQDSGYNKEYVWSHVLMRRNQNNDPVNGNINSEIYPLAESIFNRFCFENNIVTKVILRAAVNVTGYSPKKHGFIHVDHSKFDHYNFILYLNDVGGNTCIFDKDNNILYEVEPRKNKVIVFDGCPHAQSFCEPDNYRFVLVFTFIGEKND